MDLLSNHIFRESFIASMQYKLTDGFSYLYYRINTDNEIDMSVLRARFVKYYLLPKLANEYAAKCPDSREWPADFIEYSEYRKKFGNRAVCINDLPMRYFTSHEIWAARSKNNYATNCPKENR